MSAGNPFESAESYYARFRPGYGEAAVDHLVDRFSLRDDARVLDLGCGAGQLAVPLADHAREVVAMDPNEAMLEEARAAAADAGRTNIEFVHGSDADLHDGLAPIRLTTMGRSFHWMDQRATLAALRGITVAGGGVAVLTDQEWLVRGRDDWQAAVYRVVEWFLDDLPPREDPGEVEYDDPWDELLAASGFHDVETATFSVVREWSVDRIVGYVLSLSYASPATFGDDAAAFEAELGSRLDELGGGPFEQRATVEVLSGVVDD